MIEHENLARIDRFLSRVRKACQWHENKEILAPGDITPYMQTVTRATLGMLSLRLPEGALEIKRAVHASTSIPFPAKWWTFRYGDAIFDMEGLVALGKVEKVIEEQMKASGAPKDAVYLIVLDQNPDVAKLFASAQGAALKVLGDVEQAWSIEFDHPMLDKRTAASPAKSRPNGRL